MFLNDIDNHGIYREPIKFLVEKTVNLTVSKKGVDLNVKHMHKQA